MLLAILGKKLKELIYSKLWHYDQSTAADIYVSRFFTHKHYPHPERMASNFALCRYIVLVPPSMHCFAWALKHYINSQKS